MTDGMHFERYKVQYSVSERKILQFSVFPPALEQSRVNNSVSITSYNELQAVRITSWWCLKFNYFSVENENWENISKII